MGQNMGQNMGHGSTLVLAPFEPAVWHGIFSPGHPQGMVAHVQKHALLAAVQLAGIAVQTASSGTFSNQVAWA